eukprot:TRINITY_DN17223_c0_g1_i1.p1 TRINITY_DN17223_c0_g1~~TRINITY_DN17223_c0_g1_i1.p1  ORF type:complete len:458 (+),score=-96.69 TRINITY_DN17223_c0_g1_i1:107-1375(+)
MLAVLDAESPTELADTPEDADIILLNTCSVRERAEEKVFSDLGRFRKLKEKKSALIIGVGGCVASQEGENIAKRAPYIDLIFGPQTLHRLPTLMQESQKNRRAVVDIRFPEIEKFDYLPEPKAEGVTAFVSIMEGCSKYCSFCIVPYTRGEEISRPFDDVITEIVSLAEQGVREITLLGQNVNDYRGQMHDGKIADLTTLIHYIDALPQISRIRFTTSHPTAFSERLIWAYGQYPKLANQLHLPVQSGSDRILSAMKRNYTSLEYQSKIRKLRLARPTISITSDFIVGFPGETEEDFEKTLQLVAKIGFDYSFSFLYSPRPGTPAAQLPDNVEAETKKKRLALLQQRLNQQGKNITENMLNTQQSVLVTQLAEDKPGFVVGKTDNNRTTFLPGDSALIGHKVTANIVDLYKNGLLAEIQSTK